MEGAKDSMEKLGEELAEVQLEVSEKPPTQNLMESTAAGALPQSAAEELSTQDPAKSTGAEGQSAKSGRPSTEPCAGPSIKKEILELLSSDMMFHELKKLLLELNLTPEEGMENLKALEKLEEEALIIRDTVQNTPGVTEERSREVRSQWSRAAMRVKIWKNVIIRPRAVSDWPQFEPYEFPLELMRQSWGYRKALNFENVLELPKSAEGFKMRYHKYKKMPGRPDGPPYPGEPGYMEAEVAWAEKCLEKYKKEIALEKNVRTSLEWAQANRPASMQALVNLDIRPEVPSWADPSTPGYHVRLRAQRKWDTDHGIDPDTGLKIEEKEASKAEKGKGKGKAKRIL